MKAEIKEKWVAALESGQYQQGVCYLRSVDNKFCCLGVLCDVLNTGWDRDVHYVPKGYSSCKYIPFEIAKQIGLSTTKEGILMDMNDRKIPFTDIAKYIRENL